jgi:nondiscriminating glutamyl-tRNA synthetase
MRISHVIRADEHLSNTPRQVLLYRALDAQTPQFAHVAMLLGPDRQKLSKRHGAVSVAEYRAQGYLPEALLNYLALLGWTPKGQEMLSKEELIEQFDLTHVGFSPAVFDQEKLRWLNGQYLRRADDARLTALAAPYLVSTGLLPEDEVAWPSEAWLQKLVGLLKHNIITLSQLPLWAQPFLSEPKYEDKKIVKILQEADSQQVFKAFSAALAGTSQLSSQKAGDMLHSLPEQLALGTGKVFRPLRAALTGQGKGPELAEIVALLGPEKCLERVEKFRR